MKALGIVAIFAGSWSSSWRSPVWSGKAQVGGDHRGDHSPSRRLLPLQAKPAPARV